MPTLYVRNFPDDLHRKIRDLAAQKQRSVGAEVIVLVEQGIKQESLIRSRSEVLGNIAKRRRSYQSPPGAADSLTLLREDRER